jgi:hypothetical protein
MVRQHRSPGSISSFIHIVCYKTDTLTKVMESFAPNASFRRNIVGPRLASWQRWAPVQLTQGSDKFRWNLTENGIFSVDSMYRALI